MRILRRKETKGHDKTRQDEGKISIDKPESGENENKMDQILGVARGIHHRHHLVSFHPAQPGRLNSCS